MAALRLVSVYKRKDALPLLYRLLLERDHKVNISHRRMPSLAQHKKFVASKPYKSWKLILAPGGPVGAIYLSRQNEIGLFILKASQKKGYAKAALALLMKKNRKERRFLANVNPQNKRSIDFFKNMKFKHIQNTYEWRRV